MKKLSLFSLLLLFISIGLQAQFETGTVTDVEGNSYKTVKIGTTWWMAENLKTKHYQNGDSITKYPEIYFSYVTGLPVTGGSKYDYCKHYTYPNNDAKNRAVYGLNYTWSATFDSRGICPAGWTVPDSADWYKMAKTIGHGGYTASGFSEVGKYLKSAQYWNASTSASAVVAEVGFNALPSGDFNSNGYSLFGEQASFWTIHDVCVGLFGRYHMDVRYDSDELILGAYRNNNTVCVRCIMAEKATEVEKMNAKPTLTVYPNPATTQIIVESNRENANWEIYDLQGVIQLSGSFDEGTTKIISVNTLPTGLYVIRVLSSKGNTQLKFTKK